MKLCLGFMFVCEDLCGEVCVFDVYVAQLDECARLRAGLKLVLLHSDVVESKVKHLFWVFQEVDAGEVIRVTGDQRRL